MRCLLAALLSTLAAIAATRGAPAGAPGACRRAEAAELERAHRVHGPAVDQEGDGHLGQEELGVIAPHAPLIIQRPRDSGPLDVVVRADGCVPVQTRAYTFEDSKVAVQVTPNDQKNTLLGYREEMPAADGGVPASAES